MPPKTKSKGGQKKASRAVKQGEKKRLAQEKAIQRQNEHLFREIKYGKECMQRHEKRWRTMLLEVAVPQMRADLEYYWSNFERVIDSRDLEISLLLDELNAAEEQFNRSVRSHIDDIDKIIVMCYDQIGELWRESAQMIGNLYTAATFERNDVAGIAKEHENYLKTMLYMLDISKKETMKLMRGEYLSRQEVEISKLNDIRTKFTEELCHRFTHVWTQAEEFMRAHVAEYAHRKHQLELLSRTDDEMQKIIRRQWDQLGVSLEMIKTLKMRFAAMQATQARKIDELSLEMNYFEAQYKTVKRRIKDERDIDDKYLQALILQSRSVMEYLEKFVGDGEKLLTLAAICRKLETLEEKTMLFPTFSVQVVAKRKGSEQDEIDVVARQQSKYKSYEVEIRQQHVGPVGSKEHLEWIGEQVMDEFKLFWLRVASAEASRYKISEQIEFLKRENEGLKREIFKYCQCFNCTPQMEYFYEEVERVINF